MRELNTALVILGVAAIAILATTSGLNNMTGAVVGVEHEADGKATLVDNDGDGSYACRGTTCYGSHVDCDDSDARMGPGRGVCLDGDTYLYCENGQTAVQQCGNGCYRSGHSLGDRCEV